MPGRITVIFVASLAGAATASAQSRTVDQPSRAAAPDERSDWRVESDSLLVAYEVRSPRSPVTWERRRLVQRLAIGHALRADADGRWRVVTRLELRFDHDLGQVCTREDEGRCLREGDVDDRRDHQLLATDSEVDMPTASVEVQGPRATRLRLGRLLVGDATGLLRIDGARIAARPLPWLGGETYAGRQTRATSFAGSSGLEQQGSVRLKLPSGLSPDRVPWVAPPSHTWVAGGRVWIGLQRWVRVHAAAREVRDGDGLVARRIGVGASASPVQALTLRADAVWDPTDGTLLDAFAEVEARWRAVTGRARVERHVPRFDLGSIWAWFDVVAVDRARVSLKWGSRGLELGGAWQGRRAVPDERAEVDLGGEGWLSVRRGGWRATVRGWLWAGDFQPVAAVLLDAGRVLGRAELYARGSIWHFDHPFQAGLYGTSTTAAVGARATLTDVTRLRFEVEWSHNRVAGHRVRGLASLTVRAWR